MKINKKQLISFGIYVLVCLLMAIVCFWVLRFICPKLNGELYWLRHEAESCSIELKMLKNDYQKSLSECNELEGLLWIVKQEEYDINNNNCLHFSQDLKNKLEEKGIKSSIVKGKWGDRNHYWIVVWIESTEGDFIKSDENYILEDILE